MVAAKENPNSAGAERLKRHMHEMSVEQRDVALGESGSNTAAGSFVAPVFLANRWLDVARQNRVFSMLGQNNGSPPRASSFVIPRLATDPGFGVQASDNAAVTENDPTTSQLTVLRATIAGMIDISQQAIDDTTPGLDTIIFNALARQYGIQLNTQTITGSGSSGNLKGVLNASGIIGVTWTQASPTGPLFYTQLMGAVSQVSTQRFAPPTAIVMHPRRWFWLAASQDTQGRPLVVPLGYAFNGAVGAENAFGAYNSGAAMGLMGYCAGLPVYADPGIPTNLGSGTNEDRVIVVRAEDLNRWEDSTPRAETFRDIGSGTLTVRLRVYGYAAFTAESYPKGIAVISGTGLVAPAGF
jgi:HK97 family phage major capsid protein